MISLPVSLTADQQGLLFYKLLEQLFPDTYQDMFKETELTVLYLQTIHSMTTQQVATRLNLKRSSIKNYRAIIKSKLIESMALSPSQVELHPFTIFHAWFWYLAGQQEAEHAAA